MLGKSIVSRQSRKPSSILYHIVGYSRCLLKIFPSKRLAVYQAASVVHHHNPLAAETLDLIDAKLNHVRSTVPGVSAVGGWSAAGGCLGKYNENQKTWKSWVTPWKNV